MQLVRMLERIHIHDVVPRKWVFVHTHDAIRAAVAAMDDGENGFGALSSASGGKGRSNGGASDAEVLTPSKDVRVTH